VGHSEAVNPDKAADSSPAGIPAERDPILRSKMKHDVEIGFVTAAQERNYRDQKGQTEVDNTEVSPAPKAN
jgi:hypothetical protein